MSKSRHVCLKCGGTEFYTVAHIVQELPSNMSRIDIIGCDLTWHGCHIGLVDLLASEARR